ncbi:MAG: MerR family transcriptional regulator [Marinisporobacter sp.]|jgi:DNA-binding transcriptional MerR regulator|nr:MerR family transcriptional regulator [Marinisporobacter sp.]
MKKRYRIGEIAKIKNIDAQTLRYYDKMGILSPEIVNEKNNYRYYSVEQFIEVDRIKFYKILGLSLEEIKKFKKIDRVEEALETLKLQKKQMEDKIKKMQAVTENIKDIIETIEETSEITENQIEIKNCDAMYGIIGDCQTSNDWYEFEAKLLELTNKYPNYSEIGHNHGLSFIYNEKYLHSAQNKDMKKIAIPIDQGLINDSNVHKYQLGMCIVAYHKGSRHNIKDTFSRLKEYINVKQLKIRGDIIVTSIISSFIVNNEDEFLYEIKIPINDI